MAPTASERSLRTSPATAFSSALSIALMEATGSTALTSTSSPTYRKITLQGSMAPTRGSRPIASHAIFGLQAPRIT